MTLYDKLLAILNDYCNDFSHNPEDKQEAIAAINLALVEAGFTSGSILRLNGTKPRS